MTDLAAGAASEKTGIPEFSLPFTQDLLVISGTQPQTVYVKHVTTPDGQHKVGFGRLSDGEFFSHGIKWQFSLDPKEDRYAMFITYIFITSDIREIVCPTLHYSDVYRPTPDVQPERPLQQDMCIPWGQATYAFGVKVLDVQGALLQLVDPIIVVTPLAPLTPIEEFSEPPRTGQA